MEADREQNLKLQTKKFSQVNLTNRLLITNQYNVVELSVDKNQNMEIKILTLVQKKDVLSMILDLKSQ